MEAEKALKRAKVLEERRAAKRASATPMDELELMIAGEAVLTETRETIEAPVSSFQQAHAMSHRPETTAESFFQAHKDMKVTSKEQARQKQLDFLDSMKVFEGAQGRVACWDTRHVRPLGRHDENSNNVECQVHCERLRRTLHDEGCFAATAAIQGPYALGKVSRQTRSGTRSFCGRLHTSFPQL